MTGLAMARRDPERDASQDYFNDIAQRIDLLIDARYSDVPAGEDVLTEKLQFPACVGPRTCR
jgi:hypothetical protein